MTREGTLSDAVDSGMRDAAAESPPTLGDTYLARMIRGARQRFEHDLRKALTQHGKHTPSDGIVLELSRERCARSREFPGNGAWVCEAIIATEEALERVGKDETVKIECLGSLSDLYDQRSGWSGDCAEPDLEKAAELRELALESISLHNPGNRVREMEKLSSLNEKLYERRHSPRNLEFAIRYLEDAAVLADVDCRQRLEAGARCLRLKGGDDSAVDCVLEIPFDQIPKQPVSLDSMTPQRYRFLDCRSFSSRTSLRVLEFDDLPRQRYIAISYVWRALSCTKSAAGPASTMTIKGADNADPISIEVLRLACIASLKLKCELLWLDGLCIMQGSDDDKSWQIQKMYSIYQFCKVCLVLPGGLSRLVGLDEETPWIHRAWTLQEAVAPSSCQCLFSWSHGDCALQAILFARVFEVEPQTAAMADMRQLLDLSIRGECEIQLPGGKKNAHVPAALSVVMIANGRKDSVVMNALVGAIDMRGKKGMANAIWRSAIMRTASRPVDSILSIMGALGVQLDPNKFSADDRIGATVALMRSLLDKGGSAEWLGLAPSLNPGQELTTLPIIPKHSASGKAFFPTKDGDKTASEIMGDLTWWLQDAPNGSMDDEGYLTISAKTASVRPGAADSDALHFTDHEGRAWMVFGEIGSPPYAVLIGKKQRYLAGAYPTAIDRSSNLVMLIGERSPHKFRNLGYAAVSDAILSLPGWAVITLQIR